MNTITASTATLMPAPNPSAPPTVDAEPPAYEVVRFNALKHGILSRHAVLSHDLDDDQNERVRECDLDPSRFDPITGEFCPPAPVRHQKKAADLWVNAKLTAMRSQTGRCDEPP